MTQAQSGTTRYLLGDGLGSIRQVTDELGQVVSAYEYDPYGNPVGGQESGYGYTGEPWLAELGLLHLRARWYDPSTATFLSRDTVETEPPYAYVRGNPINFTDPSGNLPSRDAIEGGGFSYSCNCGWIDWNHVKQSERFAFEFVDDLQYIQQNQTMLQPNEHWAISSDIYVADRNSWRNDFAELLGFNFHNLAVVPQHTTSQYGDVTLAVSVFMDANERFETTQGGWASWWLDFAASSFSEEDFPSDIIGFYIGQKRNKSYHDLSDDYYEYNQLIEEVKKTLPNF